LPQSGGENHGGILRIGRIKIRKNPAKYNECQGFIGELFFVIFYDTKNNYKTQQNPTVNVKIMSKKTDNKKSKLVSEIGILGYGEVGQAIAKFFKYPKIKDLTRDDDLTGIKILHITIPWSDRFIEIVENEMRRLLPRITIIHSTVNLGTTKKISDDTKMLVVHSPVRGVHPNLFKGIKTFVKYIGAESKEAVKEAEKHFRALGLKTKAYIPAITTEALKLWDTTQYGWMIVLNKEMKKWCEENKLDFDVIYSEANRSYNEGYVKLGRKEVVRPNLKYMAGEIGGHCIIGNCRILKSDIAKIILAKNEFYKKKDK